MSKFLEHIYIIDSTYPAVTCQWTTGNMQYRYVPLASYYLIFKCILLEFVPVSYTSYFAVCFYLSIIIILWQNWPIPTAKLDCPAIPHNKIEFQCTTIMSPHPICESHFGTTRRSKMFSKLDADFKCWLVLLQKDSALLLTIFIGLLYSYYKTFQEEKFCISNSKLDT